MSTGSLPPPLSLVREVTFLQFHKLCITLTHRKILLQTGYLVSQDGAEHPHETAQLDFLLLLMVYYKISQYNNTKKQALTHPTTTQQ